MEISRLRALRGPNLWSRRPAIEAVVLCTKEEQNMTARMPEFETRLRERFPEIALLQPTVSNNILSMAHAIEFSTLGLQAQAGCPVTFSRTTPTIEAGTYQVVVEYSEEEVGFRAFELAKQLCQAAEENQPFDISAALHELRELDEEIRLGPSTRSIVTAALARNIPYRRLTHGSLVQFGWGSKQRRIQAAETDKTSAVSEAIAQDKELTKKLLAAAGVPVPAGRPAKNAEDAWVIACEIGLPVVLKPQDGNQGKGVTVNLTTKEQVENAYAIAFKISDEVLVEKYIAGQDHRILVVGDKVIAAARREPPMVIGDGVLSIRELVDQVNSDPRRGSGHATTLTNISFDATAIARLAQDGYTADSVPAKGVEVILRNNANLSTGGTATDVTDDVHPDFAARAIAAAQMVGLDIAGVDIVCKNVLRPLEEQGGAVVEVNAAPGLRMHLQPSYGKERPVGEAIIANMFAEGEDGRIPVIAVAGTNGKTTTVRLITNILEKNHLRVGMTTTDGIYVEGKRIDTGDCSGPKSAKNVLFHPDVDAAVLETARGGVLREGLGFDLCDVAVITNIGEGDHLGLSYINTVEDLYVVKRVIVKNIKPQTGVAVLNAADPMVVKMADFGPEQVIFFAIDKNHPVIATHRSMGKRVIYQEEEDIVVSEGKFKHRISLADVPLTAGGKIDFQIENVMAATGAAWGLGLDWKVIHAGLSSFVSDAQSAPGRFNLFDYRDATLIADYGHNPDAIRALVNAVEKMPQATDAKRIVVISGAGDRRDKDIREQTEILGAAFDEAILYQDQCQRGRTDGEVLALLKEGLKNAKRTQKIEEIRGEFLAIDTALAKLSPGDLCLVLIDQVEESLAYITERVAEATTTE